MRNAFSLVEVVIAVTIISMLSVAILQVSQNSIAYTQDSKERFRDTVLLTLDVRENLNKNKQDELFIDTLLEEKYAIPEKELQFFKDKKIAYKLESDEELKFILLDKESGMPPIDLPRLAKVTLRDAKHGSFIYILRDAH